MKKLFILTIVSFVVFPTIAQAKVQHVRKYLNEPRQVKTNQVQAAAAARINYDEENLYNKRIYSNNNLKNNFPTAKSNQR